MHAEIPQPRDPLNWTMTARASCSTTTTKQNQIYHFFRKEI